MTAATAAPALRAYLESRRGAMLDLVEELVGIDSHASRPEGVDAVGDVLARELAPLGFAFERARGTRLPPEQRWLEDFMLYGYPFDGLADHRVARKRGGGRGRVLLLGDMDTAFLPGSPQTFPFRVEGDRALGPGIADMKGGLATLVYALKALAETGSDRFEEITCVFSADEQLGSLSARQVIEPEARRADWAFCVECGRDGRDIMAARAHIGAARLETRGREAHAGSAYAKGVSAIEAMARKIPAVHALTDPRREIYLCVGQVKGGWRRTVVAGECVASIDVRTPSAAAWNATEAALRRIADAVEVPGATATLSIYAHRPSVPWTAKTDRLLAIARDAGRELGVDFGVQRSPAAGSSAFTGPFDVPCLDGLGAVGGDLMTDREHIVIPTLVERAALLSTMLAKLAAGAWEDPA